MRCLPALLLIVACGNTSVRTAPEAEPSGPTGGRAPVDLPPGSGLALADLAINEVVLSNASTLTDDFGETPDWIELVNTSDEPFDTRGCGLTDDPSSPHKWIFEDTIVEPGEHLLVLASGRDIRSVDRPVPEPRTGLHPFVWTWTDGDYETPGGSHIDPDLFGDEVYGNQDGKTVISATMYLADNSGGLGWSVAILYQGFAGWDSEADVVDLSAYNQAFLEATLAEGDIFELYLCQAGVECGSGDPVLITGNGISEYHYEIPIAGSPDGLDLSQLTGFQLRPFTIGKTMSVLVTDFIFNHTGYYLHTNFRLSAAGESVLLTDPEGETLDYREMPALPADASYGRRPEDVNAWAVFSEPTPGADNGGPAYDGVCPGPRWSMLSGVVAAGTTLSASADEGCQVTFTTDGSPPTRESAPAAAPIVVDTTTVVRSVAWSESMLESEPVTHTYFVDSAHELAVASLAVDPGLLFDPDTGIYTMGPDASAEFPYKGANFWKDVEIPATIQFFEPDGSLGFETGVGIRIFGNYSRGHDMKSLSLKFRGEYGDTELDYPIFPDHPELRPFESLVLRNSGNDFGETMFRDALASSLTQGMQLSYQQYRPTVVYINGEYWGIHNLREKLTGDYITSNFGLSSGQFDMLEPGERPQEGTAADWNAFIAELEQSGAATSDAYAMVGSQIDIDNFIDYNCAEIIVANLDWPGNNVKWWKKRSPDGRWRWILYDLDGGFHDSSLDLFVQATEINDAWPNPEWSTFLLQTLLENETFKNRFIDRCAIWLSTNFDPSTVNERIDALAAGIESEIPRFFERWELDPAEWQAEVDRVRTFASERPGRVRAQALAFFGLAETHELVLHAEGGRIFVEDVPWIPEVGTLTMFSDVPIALRAVADAGQQFAGWSDGIAAAERTVTLSGDQELTAEFEE